MCSSLQNEPRLVLQDAGDYVDLQDDDLFEVLPLTPQVVRLPSISEFDQEQKVQSLCPRLADSVTQLETQLETETPSRNFYPRSCAEGLIITSIVWFGHNNL